MAAMTGHDVFQGRVGGEPRQVEIDRQVLPGEDVGILLAEIVDGVDQRLYVAAGKRSVRILALGDVEIDAGLVAFRRPGIDEDADISFSLEQGIEVGDICFPAGFGSPAVNVDGTPGTDGSRVPLAVVPYAEGRHEAHQFDGRQEVLSGHGPDQFFVPGRVHGRP